MSRERRVDGRLSNRGIEPPRRFAPPLLVQGRESSAIKPAGYLSPGRQAGVALITVLLIVFLSSIAAVSLATMQQLAIRRSGALLHQQQARLYTLGLEQAAILILTRDRENSKTDHPGEEWANLPLTLPVEGGVVTGRIRDMQGCFNLNNLWQPAAGESTAPAPNKKPDGTPAEGEEPDEQNPDAPPKAPDKPKSPTDPGQPKTGKAGLNEPQLKLLQRLLTSLELKPELAQAIADWIDPDPDPLFPDGAEDGHYLALNPSYLAANRPFFTVSELRLVKDMDRETYAKLAPLVCALPPGTPLNVNTAPAAALAGLTEEADPEELARLLEKRPDQGYESVDEFLNAAKLTVDAPTKALLGVETQYFSLRAEARVGDGRAMLYSTLYRDENGVRVLRRSFGNQD